MMSDITAIIPVREGSRRLPNKNISPFGNSNLLLHKIEQLKKVQSISRIVVTSDSDVMLEMAKEVGVEIHKRDIEYCDEKSKSFGEVVKHVCENVLGTHILWAPCTSPLVLPANYHEGILEYYNSLKNGYDSLVSVEPFKRYIWNDFGPINYKLGTKHLPSQELEQLYFISDGIILAPRTKMIEWSYFHGINPKRFVLDKIHCVDIDDKLDLEVAKAWWSQISK